MDSSINFIMPCNISNIKFIMYAYLILFVFMHTFIRVKHSQCINVYGTLIIYALSKKGKKKKESNKILKEKRNYSIIKL